jgi:hypothetical protein
MVNNLADSIVHSRKPRLILRITDSMRIFREYGYGRLRIGGVFMTKNQNPKSKSPKVKDSFSEVSDYKDILAITEGHDWKP